MKFPAPNPLVTRADVQRAFLDLEAPLLVGWDVNETGPDLTDYRARYGEPVTRLEGLSRYLWGLAPFTAGGGQSRGWPHVLDAIVHGTDPQHPGYWGPAAATDQRSVEMASLGVALRLVPDAIWAPLSAGQKDNLAAWLTGMLDKPLVKSNWQFFRLMTTLGLRHVGRPPTNVDAIEQAAIDQIDGLYLDRGWYFDGGPDQRDYYIPWAFHFYSLLGVRLAERGPLTRRLGEWANRAETFTGDFLAWFAADGAALPFGRSLTYRFAQGAFWAGCGVAALPGLSPGEHKGMLLRHLRWWWKQPMLNGDGTLSLGYAYPNLNLLEPYNSQASPYWAFKAFAALQLPESHPFWASAEQPPPARPARRVQPQPRMVVDRDAGSGHVVAHCAGQWHTWPLRHRDAKYAKFAYSTYFGPTVGANHEWLAGCGIDNTLAVMPGDTVSEDGLAWQCHGLSGGHVVEATHLRSDWVTAPGVAVRTWLVPLDAAWHVRLHRVTTDRVMQIAEGGFAAQDPTEHAAGQRAVYLKDPAGGLSGIIALVGDRTPTNVDVEPNSSLYTSRVRTPALLTRLTPGTHWLAAAIYNAPPGSTASWDVPPAVRIDADRAAVERHDFRVELRLNDPIVPPG